MPIRFKNYTPHEGQEMFHYAVEYMYRFFAYVSGIRGGKTVGGAREAVKQAWNARGKGVYGIVAPTYNMLDRTTWAEFRDAARPFIRTDNDSKKIIVLKNGRAVHGHSAERPDRIRNETFIGFWGDETREWKDFKKVWNILLGRVLSTEGKGFITTTPNGYDGMWEVFVENSKKGYGMIRVPTSMNKYISREGIESLGDSYDEKFYKQELLGEFVIFDGQVYYTFNRTDNAGDYAFKVAQYNPDLPLRLCCDFNVDPMAWTIAQFGVNPGTKLKEVYWIDEIYLRNSNTVEACQEFRNRYFNHQSSLYLYGDATGKARSTTSNVTNWKIIKDELARYNPISCVPSSNPNERDRVNAVNGMVRNSKGVIRTYVNPTKCKNLMRDFEQVIYKEGSTQIDKGKSLELTHASDSAGYMYEREFSLNKQMIGTIKI